MNQSIRTHSAKYLVDSLESWRSRNLLACEIKINVKSLLSLDEILKAGFFILRSKVKTLGNIASGDLVLQGDAASKLLVLNTFFG